MCNYAQNPIFCFYYFLYFTYPASDNLFLLRLLNQLLNTQFLPFLNKKHNIILIYLKLPKGFTDNTTHTCFHVLKNVVCVEETLKSIEQEGVFNQLIEKQQLKRAVDFLNKQLFGTPQWLLKKGSTQHCKQSNE